MRTIKVLFMLLLITSQSAFAFDKKVDTIVVNHATCQVLQIIVTIENTDSEALWIWFDSQDYGQDYRKAIKYYLMKPKGDFSIFNIGTEPEMVGDWWHPSAPKDCFVKYLEPNHSFTIVLYKEISPTLDCSDCHNVIRGVRIFSNQQIKDNCPGIEEPYSIKRISYPHNVIAISINGLEKKNK